MIARSRIGAVLLGLALAGGLSALRLARATAENPPADSASQPVHHDDQASIQAFEAIVPVLHNPRCMNCHMRGDFPRQGDNSHPHIMDVRRGPDGHGVNGVKCSTCHQDHNLVGVHMPPGAPDWGLPSPAMPMIWQDLTDRQLCTLLKDPNQNGHRTVAQIVDHMHTPLVLWGWHPGEGRTPIPYSEADFLRNVELWANNGAVCPPATLTHPPVRDTAHATRPDQGQIQAPTQPQGQLR